MRRSARALAVAVLVALPASALAYEEGERWAGATRSNQDAGVANESVADDDVACAMSIAFADYEVDGELPILPPPITAARTTELREGFDWAKTRPLPERDAAGRPTLFYAWVMLRSPEDEETLELAQIHYDAMPLFEEELAPWDGRVGVVELEHDGEGAFVYAIVTGATYNLLREAALEGEPLLGPVILIDVPAPEARRADGSLDYRYLVERGFTYVDPGRATPETHQVDDGAPKRARRFRLFRRVRRFVRAVFHEIAAVVRGIRELAGDLREAIAGDRPFRIEVRAANVREHVFDGRADPQTGAAASEMRRAWGANLGEPLRLGGVPIAVRSRFALSSGELDARGVVELRVPKGRRYGIMLRLQNRAATLVGAGGVWQKRLVLFGPRGLDGSVGVPRDGLAVVRLDALRHPDVNGLLQMQDGWDFAERVFGVRPRRAYVNMGARRDDAGERGRVAVTLCARLLEEAPFVPGRGPRSLVGHRDGVLVGLLANTVGSLWETWDITLNGDSRFSRSAPTHEYGHFLMCDLVFRADPGALVSYYGEYMSSALVHGGRGEASIVGEPIADFFASQVAGGLSYLTPQASSGELVGRYFYCDAAPPAAPWCLEDNVGGPSQQVIFDANGDGDFDDARDVLPKYQAMTIVGTLLTDAFDGHHREGDVPHDGAGWDFGSEYPIRATPARGVDHGDERVALPGASYPRLFERLTETSLHLERTSLYRALAETMLERGVVREDVCRVFALHASDGRCESLIDLDAFSGAAPIAPLGLAVALASPRRREEGARANLAWNDASPEADGYEVAVLDGPRRVASASLPYARRATWITPELPFDRAVIFEVRTRSGIELGPPARVATFTPAEPVEHVAASPAGALSIHVAWKAVSASRYLVRWRGVRTGATRERVTDATALDIDVPEQGEYVFEVISLNAFGAKARFPSLEARVFLVTPS